MPRYYRYRNYSYRKKRKTPFDWLDSKKQKELLSMSYQKLLLEQKNSKNKIEEIQELIEVLNKEREELQQKLNNAEIESEIVIDNQLEYLHERYKPDLDGLLGLYSTEEAKQQNKKKKLKLFDEWFETQKRIKDGKITIFLQIEKKADKLDKEIRELNTKENELNQLIKSYPRAKTLVKKKENSSIVAAHKNRVREAGSNVSQKLRKEKKYPYDCPYCNQEISKGYDHVDHIMPIAKGGMSVIENMILVCEGCNLEKSDQTLRNFCEIKSFDFDKIAKKLEKQGKWV